MWKTMLPPVLESQRKSTELGAPASITAKRQQPLRLLVVERFLLLCGLPGFLAAIFGRFSSSSLPPSFARGRRTTVFIAQSAWGPPGPAGWLSGRG